MVGARRSNSRGELQEYYRCPPKGAGGCGSVTRIAAPVNAYIKALVIAEQQKNPVPQAGRHSAVAESAGAGRPSDTNKRDDATL
jgi:hypothetical protein